MDPETLPRSDPESTIHYDNQGDLLTIILTASKEHLGEISK